MGFVIKAEFPGKPPVSMELVEGIHVVIGRASQATLKVPDDLEISRLHAEVLLEKGHLIVRRNPESTNPVYREGRPVEEFALGPGDCFTIGKTKFTFVPVEPPKPAKPPAPAPLEQSRGHVELLTMSAKDLYAMGDASSGLKFSVLLEVPELLRQHKRKDFYEHIARMVRGSTDGAWACVVTEAGKVLGEDSVAGAANSIPGRSSGEALAAGAAQYLPSKTLIRKACEEAPQPTVYSWSKPQDELATAQVGLDWAVCAAAKIPGQEAVVFYVAGTKGSAGTERLQRERARFVGLIADMVGRSIVMDRLTTWEGRLERFFAGPVVSKILNSPDLKEIDPKLAISTVLFFDIRGFSKRTEEKNEVILQYIGELRRAMTAMTAIILEEQGVVLQYMGDGILACWNVPFEEAGHVDRAATAALRMAETFGRQTGGWHCGIGLHTGEVVAGAIGSEQVFAYGLLGRVVNQASRVEGITKALGVQILASEAVAMKVSIDVAVPVPVGCFRPAGMAVAMDLYELTPPPGDRPRLAAFKVSLDEMKKGNFDETVRILGSLPPGDKPAAYLRGVAEELRRRPPAKWEGVIELSRK
ncbi:MAG: FHA domain-containing protein [Elusimicrobia bacterium]|nr:FHA domain-containing protein [Elusimicrobiota bacterium]